MRQPEQEKSNMVTLDQIGSHLSDGFSVFYAITESCTHTLGYLPEGKALPAEDAFALSDELHEERRIAQQWLSENVSRIRHEIIPAIEKTRDELAQYRTLEAQQQPVSNEGLQNTLESLGRAIGNVEAQARSLHDWTGHIRSLHDEAASKAHYGTDPDCYSWQDAAEKLGKVEETGEKMTISWVSIAQIVEGARKDLERAEKTTSEIVKEMFSDAAARQWNDAVEIAEKMMEIR